MLHAGNIRRDTRTAARAHILQMKELQYWRNKVLRGGPNAPRNKVHWKERTEVVMKMSDGKHFSAY